jgi:hypothetical protein
MLWRTPAVVIDNLLSRANASVLAIDAAHLDNAVDFGPVQAACVIDAAAELRPFYARKRRNRLDPLQVDLALLAGVGRPAILFPDRIGGQRLQLAKPVNAEQHHQHRDGRGAGFEFLRQFPHQLIPDGVRSSKGEDC